MTAISEGEMPLSIFSLIVRTKNSSSKTEELNLATLTDTDLWTTLWFSGGPAIRAAAEERITGVER